MKYKFLILILLFTCQVIPSGKGAYNTNKYPDLFSELLGKSEEEVRQKINSAYNQIFFGDDSTQRLYYPFGSDKAFILDFLHNDIRSEGMSYGMMIAVQMDKKEEFDKLWKFAKNNMQIQAGQQKGYFAWQIDPKGNIIDSTTASDGEEWFVTSLFFASNRWGDGEGIFNYKAEAQAILDAMLSKGDYKPGSVPVGTITNMFNRTEKKVVFVPEVQAAFFTDPSYHLPHYYELWGRWADKEKDFWLAAADTSRNYFKRTVHPVTGLAPQYSHFDGRPINPWGSNNDDFFYDSWRVAANVAVDYLWFAADDWAVEQSNRLLKFFYSEGIDSYASLYKLDGTKIDQIHGPALAAMNAVAALAADADIRKDFVERLWNLPVPSGLYRYYDGTLYMLAMLQVSGNFKIYHPRD